MKIFHSEKSDYFVPAIWISLAIHSLAFSLAGRISSYTDYSVTPGEQSIEYVVLKEESATVTAPGSRSPQLKSQTDSVPFPPEMIAGSLPSDRRADRGAVGPAEKPFVSAGAARMSEVVVHPVFNDNVTQGAVVEGTLRDSNNPAPRYPHIARERGWEGVVDVRAFVELDGAASKIELEKSSGYDILDKAALEAVKIWQFRAARNGDAVLSSWVDIPIRFRLIDK